uniref:glycosyltransferase n=1 Tax=Streptomyces scabiei TaxID=1930 RepID=UPI00211AB55A
MKIGIVCPYSWDVPGGVQFHIRDLADHLIRLGHEVSVLAPADDDTPLPPYVVSAGRRQETEVQAGHRAVVRHRDRAARGDDV